jgi:membrane protein DedA with SNARE-associated domain
MSDYLLTQIINYGAPLFGLILFLAALGLPLPASILLVAAGAFSQQGILNGFALATFGLVGVVAGDVIGFGMGFYARKWVSDRIEGSPTWKNARDTFKARAGMAVFLTRFLLTALAVPTNWIAGGSGIPFRRFLIYDTLGELTWIILYGGLGYLFGSQWELVGEFIKNFGGLIMGLFIVGAGVWLWNKRLKNIENAKHKVPET